MPNWCKNAMLVTGSKADIDQIISKVKTQETDFDFNGIISMPETLSVEASSTAKAAYAVFYGTDEQQRREVYAANEVDYQEKITQIRNSLTAKNLAETYHKNKENYGHATWYEWCNDIWGTKWNAGDANMGEFIHVAGSELYQVDFFFETAWSYPTGIFQALAEQYPKVTFSVDVDEEGGYFWGNILIQNGEVIENLQEGTRPGGPYDYTDYAEEE